MSGIHQAFFMVPTPSSGSGYRYYRLNISASNSGSFLIVAELELRATVGGADLTTPATPVTQSAQDGTGNAGSMVVDNDINTTWNSSVAAPWWVRMDLGTAQTIAQVQITRLNATAGFNGAPKNFTVEGSNDGTSFSVLGTFSVADWGPLSLTFNL